LHRAILLTEAALRDTNRYGLRCEDNCKWRAQQVDGWLAALREGLPPGEHIVDERPSGTVWVTRAARAAILDTIGQTTTGTQPIVHLKLAKAYERLYRYSRSLEYLVEAQCHLRDALAQAHQVSPRYVEGREPGVLEMCRKAFAREALVRLARLVLLWEERGSESPLYSGRQPPWPSKPNDWPQHFPAEGDHASLFECLWSKDAAPRTTSDASVRVNGVRAFVHGRDAEESASRRSESENDDEHHRPAAAVAGESDADRRAQLQAKLWSLEFSRGRTIATLFEQKNECGDLRVEVHDWIERIRAGTRQADWKLLQLLEGLSELQTNYVRAAESRARSFDHKPDLPGRSVVKGHLASSTCEIWRSALACAAKVGRTIEELCGFVTFESHNRAFKHELLATRVRAEALGQLGRYCEAHNLTNRALGLLTNSHLSHVDALWGRLDRTRGAIHLWEALSVFDEERRQPSKPNWHEFVLSLLDDAWIAFERAEPCLRRSRALVRLRLYQMRTIAALQELEKDYKDRQDHKESGSTLRIHSLVDHSSGSRCYTALDLMERFFRHPTKLKDQDSARAEMLGLGQSIADADANPGSAEHSALLRGLVRRASQAAERPKRPAAAGMPRAP
ncbi:MAG: hypothetical protein RL685_1941, partial [Pseudomonadota bacterium]